MARTPPPPAPPVPATYRIVVGVDYSPLAERALHMALSTAAYRDTLIYALTVLDGHLPSRPGEVADQAESSFTDEARHNLDQYLSAQLSQFDTAHGTKLNRNRLVAAIDQGDPAASILDLAKQVRADLIVVGTHSRTALEQLLVGSVAESVLRGAHCPVLVLKPKAHQAGD